jgi:hypothetical protein
MAGTGKYVSWGYLPHEDKYNKPTIEDATLPDHEECMTAGQHP